jgi:hypothetical protein
MKLSTSASASSMRAASFGTLGAQLIGDLTPLFARRFGVVLDEGGADEGGDHRRPWWPACAKALRMKCTRQRCQEACSNAKRSCRRPSKPHSPAAWAAGLDECLPAEASTTDPS